MSRIFIVSLFSVSVFLISSCSDSIETPPVTESSSSLASQSVSGELEYSSTTDIALDLTASYRYLDSENKSYSSGSLGELISHTPYTIVYFYPKDGTPNCTIQALDFSLMKWDFLAAGYEIIGVSSDSVDSHMLFAEKNALKIKLLEDASGALLEQFGNKWPLQTYGNGDDVTDIRRSTFIIDSTGKPTYAFRDITANGHARRIYELVTRR